MSVSRVASSCRRDRGEGSSWALARSARARRRGSGPSTPSSSPTWSIARGWGITCVNGRRSCVPRSGWSGWASAWTGSARCTAPGWCCAPTSCGRRIPTTTPSAPGPACAGSMPWCGSPTASPPIPPRRPSSRWTGGGCTGSSSTIPAALRTSWSNRSSGCTASSTASRKKRSGPPRSTARPIGRAVPLSSDHLRLAPVLPSRRVRILFRTCRGRLYALNLDGAVLRHRDQDTDRS